ncbi:hypothetical protein [Gordonia sp. (in: high G+C Gram-positive bacteria)]|jgi:hypothetical protein|uniref:hypothetical protein n=1 Tax=Gordonia sp. (in: high G+C Gram-positive bacteria) TaxID=84139 RepID=UPI001D227521|nr:hypothetical protein [Gordonia sp. (in: high G+C Gram-positive bacteria)]MCB1294154.1 hypothetical protein [Gordonia sp. (in: high G+C Gram-positive bacteria)]HMS76669.1 hypothetical protein [Gordonia sp. (in: high G+C Gram-positive bacteria)]HQV19921.1 hypothetical protein [Gordonia sp. (in: high G+C Gram-positive bacteria)]
MSAAAVGAFGLAIALGTSACGAGQVSQTTSQEPAVNGGSAKLGALLIRDVTFVWPTDAEASAEAGGPYDIAFLISNESATVADKLVAVTPTRGTVTITGDATINPGKALQAGEFPGLAEDTTKTSAPSSAAPSASASATSEPESEAGDSDHLKVTLTGAGDTVRVGVSTQLTFKFEKAGEVRVQVPLNAGPDLERQDKVRGGEAGH